MTKLLLSVRASKPAVLSWMASAPVVRRPEEKVIFTDRPVILHRG